jgi:hypothetical protein
MCRIKELLIQYYDFIKRNQTKRNHRIIKLEQYERIEGELLDEASDDTIGRLEIKRVAGSLPVVVTVKLDEIEDFNRR